MKITSFNTKTYNTAGVKNNIFLFDKYKKQYDFYDKKKIYFGADVKFDSELKKLSNDTHKALDFYMIKHIKNFCNITNEEISKHFTPIFKNIISNSKNELEFYKELSKEVNKYIDGNNFRTSNGNGKSYAEKVCNMLQGRKLPQDAVYLDIGCGNGITSKAAAQSLNINEGNAFGIDISEPLKIEGVNILKFDGKNIPGEIPSFDFATFFNVLHHIKNEKQAKNLLKSVYTRMKDKGYLLIREHEIKNNQDKLFWKIIHELKSKVMCGFYPSLDNGVLYLPSKKWENILKDIGFKILDKKLDGQYDNHSSYLLLAQK